MPKTPVTGFRLAPELLERVDTYAKALAQATGLPVSRASALAKLLTIALDHEKSQFPRPKRPSSRAPRR